MYELEITKQFSGAHSLTGYPGDCRKLHGHNWQVTVYLQAGKLDEIGIALDFKILKKELNEVIDRFDHVYLNDLPEFAECNPTSENIARIIYCELGKRLNDDRIKVNKVSVEESPGSRASYFE
ncbi:MAG: 6-carboxytetrahydropterin synthase QueD [Lentisphaeria bacterium]|nr:6-carboxytetrahydropterin synthase QueD [Lentisphaerota bacterium]MBR7145311.1 6-carboxytetrahydropterin synthase QueD [Lentisphaeria bacterium]